MLAVAIFQVNELWYQSDFLAAKAIAGVKYIQALSPKFVLQEVATPLVLE